MIRPIDEVESPGQSGITNWQSPERYRLQSSAGGGVLGLETRGARLALAGAALPSAPEDARAGAPPASLAPSAAAAFRGTRLETARGFLGTALTPSPTDAFTLLSAAPLSATLGFLVAAALARGFSAVAPDSAAVVVVVADPVPATSSLTTFGLRGARGFLAGAAPGAESGAEFAPPLLCGATSRGGDAGTGVAA